MTESSDSGSAAETPIMDVICNSDVSVRLSNALHFAASHDLLPYRTVQEYVRAGPTAKEKFLCIQNLGRRSADELDALITGYIKSGLATVTPGADSVSTRVFALREALIEIFAGLAFPAVFLDRPISKRLALALISIDHPPACFSEFLRDYHLISRELFSLSNVGRTSIAELRLLCRDLLWQLFAAWGYSDEYSKLAESLIIEQTPPADELALAQLEELIIRTRQLADPYVALKPQGTTLTAVADELIAALAPREQRVIERRYGWNDSGIETLEQIALDYGLTRERIRQIEARALRRLSLPAHAGRLRPLFEKEIPAALATATQGIPFIRVGEESATLRRLPCALRLAKDVLYSDHDTFLREFTTFWNGGWLLGSISPMFLDETLSQIEHRLAAIKLPTPVQEVISGIDAQEALIAVELGTPLHVFEGYALTGRLGVRSRRTVRLHRVLAKAGRILDVRDLLAQYHSIAPDDQCSVRDAIIVMLNAPHLFLSVFDGHWTVVSSVPSVEIVGLHEEPVAAEVQSEKNGAGGPDEPSICQVLRQVLSRHGPLRFVELRERASRELRGKSLLSVGPILLTSGEFIRPLPGIYALPEQIPALSFLPYDAPRFLLSEEQARWFAMARFAGEPFGRYPLWGPEAEYALCRWAQRSADALTYQSLLFVASIDQWPVSPAERRHWTGIKQNHARYGLASSPRYALSQLLPPLDRVLAACCVARQDNGLSWITANRILKYRLDAHVSAGLLALMVSIGALKPAPHWQRWHECADRLDDTIQHLAKALHEHASIEWTSAAGQHLVHELSRGRCNTRPGWVDRNSIDELILATSLGSPAPVSLAQDADESAATFDALLKEAARAEEAERIQQTLHSVTSAL